MSEGTWENRGYFTSKEGFSLSYKSGSLVVFFLVIVNLLISLFTWLECFTKIQSNSLSLEIKRMAWSRQAKQAIFLPEEKVVQNGACFVFCLFLIFNNFAVLWKENLFWLYFKFYKANSFPLPIVQWNIGHYLHLQDLMVLLLSCFSPKKNRKNKAFSRLLGSHWTVLSLCSLWRDSYRLLISPLRFESLFVICKSSVKMGSSFKGKTKDILVCTLQKIQESAVCMEGDLIYVIVYQSNLGNY